MKRSRKGQGSDDEGGMMPLATLLPGIMEAITIAPEPPTPKALTPQARHHRKTADQINELLDVRDGNPDIGFMTRLLTLCSLPRTDPGERLQYIRKNGPYTLGLVAGVENKLPYGNLPRLLLAWVCTEAVRTQSRDLHLGHSLAEFMRELGINSDSGGSRGARTLLRTQIDRLFNAHVQLVYETPGRKSTVSSTVADRTDLWWDYKSPTQDTLWQSSVRLGESLFEEIIKNRVPLDMRILKAMRRSSLGLDLYLWLSYKTYTLYAQSKKPERLNWHVLYRQFGSDPANWNDKRIVDAFRTDVLREMKKLKLCWPTLDYATPKGFLEVRACVPSITPQTLPAKAAGSA